MNNFRQITDCSLIKDLLRDMMVLGRQYDLSELYKMVESNVDSIEDLYHKIRAVLESRDLGGRYRIVYHGNATYSLERVPSSLGTPSSEREVA